MESTNYPWRTRLIITRGDEHYVMDKHKARSHSDCVAWVIRRMRRMLSSSCESVICAVMDEDRQRLVLTESQTLRDLINLLIETINLTILAAEKEASMAFSGNSADHGNWKLTLDIWDKTKETR